MHYFITLKINKKLEKPQLHNWFNIVNQFIQADTFSNKKIKISKKNDEYSYKIDLNTHVTQEDIMFISYAWESVYDGNFEILASDHYSLEEEELYKLKEKISRYIHNNWVDEKISEGWRYGINNNSNQKTSPYLRNWDSLPKDFRKILELDAKKAVDFSKKYF